MKLKNIVISTLLGVIIANNKFWMNNTAMVTAGVLAAVSSMFVLTWADENISNLCKRVKAGIKKRHNMILWILTLCMGVLWIICRIGICLSGWMSNVYGIGYVCTSLWIVIFIIINFEYVKEKVYAQRKDCT